MTISTKVVITCDHDVNCPQFVQSHSEWSARQLATDMGWVVHDISGDRWVDLCNDHGAT